MSSRFIRLLIIPLLALLIPTSTFAQDTNLRGSSDVVRVVPADDAQVRYSYAPLVKKVFPAVVNVYAERQVQRRRSPFADDPFFEQFFGRNRLGAPRQRQPTAQSLGSGVIVGADGIVITNNHVIEGADEIKVSLADGREFAAEIKLIDKRSDLAVLKISSDEQLPAIRLGDSEDLEVGDLVLALGNPFGVGQTVTSGIVSALARSKRGVNDFGFFIQTDASINPGNSGGALVSMSGQLIGINTAIFTKSGGSNGIGFAVPSNMVQVVLDSVAKGSDTLLRPWIGARFQAVTADIADSLGLVRPTGALVAGLTPDGPAEKAGLKLGDVIVKVDAKPVPHVDALGYRLSTAGIGRDVNIEVISKAQRKSLVLSLLEAPEEPARNMRLIEGRSPFTGLVVANLSPRVAQELEMLGDGEGVVIMEVSARSPAARLGFRPKDILVELNGEPIDTTTSLAALASRRVRGWELVVERDGKRYRRSFR